MESTTMNAATRLESFEFSRELSTLVTNKLNALHQQEKVNLKQMLVFGFANIIIGITEMTDDKQLMQHIVATVEENLKLLELEKQVAKLK